MAASIFDEELARWNDGGSSDPALRSNRPNYHPAPRVVVDVKGVGRTLSERASRSNFATVPSLLAEARNMGYWPFRTCFEQSLRNTPELNGQVQVRLRIAASGRVVQARLRAAKIPSRATADCVLRAAGALTFRKPPARRVDVDLSVKFWPGDAPLPARNEPGTPGWNSGPLGNALAANAAELAQCCAEALARDAKLWGRLAFLVDVNAAGNVIASKEVESRFPDHEASECMRGALSRLPALPTPVPPQFMLALRCGHPPVQAPITVPSASEPASSEPSSSPPPDAPQP